MTSRALAADATFSRSITACPAFEENLKLGFSASSNSAIVSGAGADVAEDDGETGNEVDCVET